MGDRAIDIFDINYTQVVLVLGVWVFALVGIYAMAKYLYDRWEWYRQRQWPTDVVKKHKEDT